MNDLVKSTLAEFVGTFALVFIGALAVTVAGSGGGVIVAALGHGLILAGMIYAFGGISAAQYNPAVTIALLIGRQTSVTEAVAHILAQFAGAIAAAYVVLAALNGAPPELGLGLGETTGSLTANLTAVFIMEGLFTFFLVTVIYQAAVYGTGAGQQALAIGFTLAACILAGGAYTGASLNPARTFGPALAAGDLTYFLPYAAAQIVGAIVAAGLHITVFNRNVVGNKRAQQ